MIEFEHRGEKYQAARMDAINQMHVHRRILPVVLTLVPFIMSLGREAGATTVKDQSMAALGAVIRNATLLPKLGAPFAEALASMPNEQFEFVLYRCLAVVKRFHKGAWGVVYDEPHKAIMFSDLDWSDLTVLMVRVIQANLGNFIEGLLTTKQTGDAAKAA